MGGSKVPLGLYILLLTIETRDITVAIAPAKIIGFYCDTNYINHAQIRYVWEIKHSPSGLVRYLPYVPIGPGLCNT